MPLRFRRFLLILLLLAVPLQGVASAVHALACTPQNEHAGAGVADTHDAHHSQAGHEHGAPHPHSGDAGDGDHASHQCCHHSSSAAAPAFGTAADTDLPVFLSSLSLLVTLFFPEQPQRPPRG